MEIPFSERLKSKAKHSLFWAIAVAAIIFVGGAIEHEFYAWFDQQILLKLPCTLRASISWITIHWISTIILSEIVLYLVVFLWAWLEGAIKPPLEIVSPFDGETVDYSQEIIGFNRSGEGKNLQVLVYSGNKWHPQWAPAIEGRQWKCRCHFGDTSTVAGTAFQLIAILAHSPVDSAVDKLPERARRSAIVKVRRSANPAVDVRPGIYIGSQRSMISENWTLYDGAGEFFAKDEAAAFRGDSQDAWRYPREQTQTLGSATFLAIRYRPTADIEFYAHFRDSLTLLINSVWGDWSLGENGKEFRVPIPSEVAVPHKWHVLAIFLPCLEQMLQKPFDVVNRFSVRGTLTISHIWCLDNISELPQPFLADIKFLKPPIPRS